MSILRNFKALTFDVYGTLIDWETGMLSHLQPWAQRQGLTLDADALLSLYGEIELRMERDHPRMLYPEVVAGVLRAMATKLGVSANDAEAAAFGDSVGDWPAFADSAPALAYLKQHYQLCVLSNVDHGSIRRSIRKLGVEFDHVITAQDVGSYKPDLRNFGFAVDHLADRGIARTEILHMAQSLLHDHAPSNRMGIANCWVDRRFGRTGSGATSLPAERPTFTFSFPTLAAFADFHRQQLSH